MEIGDSNFCVIRGDNASGKTSIQEGIQMALTLTAPGLPPAGQGYEKKIKYKETKAVITTDVQGKNHLVQRKVVLNTNTSGKSFEDKCIDEEAWIPMPFANGLKNNKEALTVATYTDYFIGTKDEEKQKNLIAKLVLPPKYDFPQDKVDAVNEILGAGVIDFAGDPFTAITKAHKKLYDERTNANRRVTEFVVPDELPLEKGVDSVSIQAKLTASRDARQRILNEKDAAVKKASASENERTRVQTKLDGILNQITEEKAKLPNVEAGILPESKHKELVKIAAGKEAADKHAKERAIVAATIAGLNSEIDRIKGLLEKFADAGAKCPTCEQEVDMRVLETLLRVAQEELTEAQEKDTTILRAMKTIGDVDGALAAIAKHDKAKEDQRAINQVITEKENMARVGKEKLASMGEKVDAAAEFEQPLIDADNEINAITLQLRPVIAAEERAKEIKAKTETLEKLKASAAKIDALVKWFDKDGIKATLLSENVAPFEIKINEVLSAWGYSASLSVEPWFFNVTKPNDDVVPISEISGAEEIEFACAFQCAVSRAAGLGLVVVDEVDRLLAKLRPALYRKLYDMVQNGILEQVILILADDSQKVPPLPNSSWFWCEEGTIHRLEQD
jgi:DNA repair exonuclease SbcCD ATPase subunit